MGRNIELIGTFSKCPNLTTSSISSKEAREPYATFDKQKEPILSINPMQMEGIAKYFDNIQ